VAVGRPLLLLWLQQLQLLLPLLLLLLRLCQ
jgi:hypothetical protein